MSAGNASGIVEGVRIDLKRLHESWMEIVYPRQVDADQTVLGKWTPDSQRGWITYRAWGVLGWLLLAIVYPMVLFGYVMRAQTSRLDWVAAYIGAIGTFLVLTIMWGSLTVVAHLELTNQDEVFAVLVASVVAVIAGMLAYLFRTVGGRVTTVLFAYPFAMTALFLPPIVAAFYNPTIQDAIFAQSTDVAHWINDTVLSYGGIAETLRARFDLEGIAHAIMWFGISFPVGWLIGVVVTLANYVRPSDEE
ncbi:hypothetical protein [Halorhabdus amylolytica]|uniref:hypothetical protein n=1 Tax=Halorhabdus amylolytica TaxID=2559573 RepID=UPI0010AAE025|nr:hypothetical protein [Halorhabdus amylolytica]